MNLELIIKANIEYIKNVPKNNRKGFMTCLNFTLLEGIKNGFISKEKAEKLLKLAKETAYPTIPKIEFSRDLFEHNRHVTLSTIIKDLKTLNTLTDKEREKKASNIVHFSCTLCDNGIIKPEECETILNYVNNFYTKDAIRKMTSHEILDW